MPFLPKLNVGELKKLLNRFDDHQEVWFSSDEEGNTIHSKALVQLSEITEGKIVVVIYPLNTSEDVY